MKVFAFTLSTALAVAAATAAAPAFAAHGRGPTERWQGQPAVWHKPWQNVGVVHATGREDTLALDRRLGRIDHLRLEATRGAVGVREVVLTARDGRRYVLPVHQQLRAGEAHLVRLPGPAQRFVSVELSYAGAPGGAWRRGWGGGRAVLAVSAR